VSLYWPKAKKRVSTAISAPSAAQTAAGKADEQDHPTGDAVKKSKLEETTNDELHKTKPVLDNDDGAMEMDTGDSDEERYISKDAMGGLSREELQALEEDRKLMEAMGFPTSFGSTKGKHVEGNDVYASHKIKVRKVRQLVNKKSKPKGGPRPNNNM
jgi:hypothetical protein